MLFIRLNASWCRQNSTKSKTIRSSNYKSQTHTRFKIIPIALIASNK